MTNQPLGVCFTVILYVIHDYQQWYIKGRGMYCSVYGKVHIKDLLLLIEKSSLCGGSGFLLISVST